jgi:hypothetical protein
MKDILLTAYSQRHTDFKTVRATYPDDDLAGPFLMSPNDKYAKQLNPLLIIGQETYGWSYHVDDLVKQMEVYEKFNVGEDYYASPFWNVTRKVEKALGNEAHSCAWTNFSKYDLDGGRAYGDYETTISTLDNVLVDEIRILQPKVCIFFTGPSFDNRIRNVFDGVSFEQVTDFDLRQLCQLKHADLPILTFKTYHPNYLRRSGQETDFIKFITDLAK